MDRISFKPGKVLSYLLLMVLPLGIILFKQQLVPLIFTQTEGQIESTSLTFAFFLLISGIYFWLGHYVGRTSKAESENVWNPQEN